MAVPAFLHSSRTVILPKGELHEEPEVVRATAGGRRPIALMQTGTKLITLQLNRELGAAAAAAVHGAQAGFIFGRRLEDNIWGGGWRDGCV